MGKILTRSISGLVYIALIFASIYIGYWGVWALGFFFLFMGTRELCRLLKVSIPSYFIQSITGLLYLLLTFKLFNITGFTWPLVLAFVPVILILILVAKPKQIATETGNFALLFIYLLTPLVLLNHLFLSLIDEQIPLLLLGILALIWTNDTFAFLAGSSFGKNRLWESVSPKKSWEGLIGGAIATAVAGYFLALQFDISALHGIILGLIVTIFATFGDFYESALKRNAGVKDSGNIMPGHGGILDRIDSILFVIPACFAYLLIIEKIAL